MGILEVVFEIVMFWKLNEKHKVTGKKIYNFKWFFGLLAIGDFFYMFFYYFLKLSSRTWYSVIFTTLPYTVSYIYGSIYLIGNNFRRKILLKSKFAITVYLACLPLALRLLILPLLGNITGSETVLFVLLEVAAVFSLYFLLCHSVMTFIASTGFFWSNISSAMIILVVSDWALRVEKLLDNAPAFGFYEALYCLGVSTMVASFTEMKRLPRIGKYTELKLTSEVKKITLAAAFASTLFLSVSRYGTRESIRLAILGIIFGVYLVQVIGLYLNDQIFTFTSTISKLAEDRTGFKDRKNIRLMPRELVSAFEKVTDLQVSFIRDKLLSEKAAQVSHDIRSPLAALEMISGSLHELPEEKRLLVRNSVNRIRDIANDLLSDNRKKSIVNSVSDEMEQSEVELVKVLLLEPLIESIVSEKRIQYRNHIHVVIEFGLDAESYGLFASVRPNNFKRVMSNLIGNAIESLPDFKGNVKISINSSSDGRDDIIVTVADTGVGMEKAVMEKIGERGFSFNKTSGNGLGLSHALIEIKSSNGRIDFDSKPGVGTKVFVRLPKSRSPDWFVPEIRLKGLRKIIVLDDDPSVHEIWRRRFEQYLHAGQIELINFSSSRDFSNYYRKNFADLEDCLFLVDYEISNQGDTGLDVIETLGIQNQSVLVTSYYDDDIIRDRCARIGVRFVPKMMAGFVPVGS